MAGMVASPTPTMPISDDSMSTIVRRGPSTRASAAAVIQPAVPPPAMTTDLTSCVDIIQASQGLPVVKRPPPAIADEGRRRPAPREERLLERVVHRQRVHRTIVLILDQVVRSGIEVVEDERLIGEIRA